MELLRNKLIYHFKKKHEEVFRDRKYTFISVLDIKGPSSNITNNRILRTHWRDEVVDSL